MKSADYLDAVKVRHGLASDYQLAKVLSVGQSAICNYRSGRSIMDATMCVKLSELLAVPAIEVIAAAELERARRPEVKKVWLRYAAAVALCAIGLTGSPPATEAGQILHNSDGQPQNTHMRRKRRKAGATLASAAAVTLSALARYARASLPMIAF